MVRGREAKKGPQYRVRVAQSKGLGERSRIEVQKLCEPRE